MTGLRFQLMGLYLAAVGFILSRGSPSSLTAALVLGVSIGLWMLDVRNRDLLSRHGKRGRRIEREWGYQRTSNAGGDGFFLDAHVPAELQLLWFRPRRLPGERLHRVISHGLAIDVVFLGVIGYLVVLLALPGR